MKEFRLLAFEPITFTPHTPRELLMLAHPQRPFRPRYLFIDPADGLTMQYCSIGQNRELQESTEPLPGELFAMPGMVGALKMERSADRLVVAVDPNHQMPPPLDMDVAMPGCHVRLMLGIRQPLRGAQTLTVHAVLVGEDVDR